MTASKKEFQIGDVLDDKTVYAGDYDRRKKIYAAPQDATLAMTFNEAADYARKLNKENYLGNNDWRVPTIDELGILSKNKDKGALKDTFSAAGGYWSSTPGNSVCAFNQWFSGGQQGVDDRNERLLVRCVR